MHSIATTTTKIKKINHTSENIQFKLTELAPPLKTFTTYYSISLYIFLFSHIWIKLISHWIEQSEKHNELAYKNDKHKNQAKGKKKH